MPKQNHLQELTAGEPRGTYLSKQLANIEISNIDTEEFIELLVRTKKPQIFAESAVFGNGTDWNHKELSILGDISIATPVTVYDNGKHSDPKVHEHPFQATLLFTAGALLRNGQGETPADWEEVISDGAINSEAYNRLYARRLIPPLLYANDVMKKKEKMAFITIPGLGCGQFAGPFEGELGAKLQAALMALLENHGGRLSNTKAIYYDPHKECENERIEIGGIHFLVRPISKGNEGKSQLCPPEDFEEEGDDFGDCELFSFVAWDHVSWPGNDFFAGSRATDDGVKAAATNSMAVMTGIDGQYDSDKYKYQPPTGYGVWAEVVETNNIHLEVVQNLLVFS